MTAKEKAKQLVYMYWDVEDIDFSNSIKCALIAVDEIIEELLECGEVWMKSRIIYWQEVKHQINKL
jgi:hypothetical protein